MKTHYNNERRVSRLPSVSLLLMCLGFLAPTVARAQVWLEGRVTGHQTDQSGNPFFPGGLSNNAQLGYSVANLGDVNQDGFEDLAVGVPDQFRHADNSTAALWLTFGGAHIGKPDFLPSLTPSPRTIGDWWAVVGPGDVDGDGVVDVIYFFKDVTHQTVFQSLDLNLLNKDGSSKGFGELWDPGEVVITSLAYLGSYTRSTVRVHVLAIGIPSAVSDLQVRLLEFWWDENNRLTSQVLESFVGGLPVQYSHQFPGLGTVSLATLKQFDGGTTAELAVGTAVGVTIYEVDRDPDYSFTAIGEIRRADLDGAGRSFATSLASFPAHPGVPDLNGDAVPDLAVGEPDTNRVWLFLLKENSSATGKYTVNETFRISETEGNFEGELRFRDDFGYALASTWSSRDNYPGLVVGAPGHDSPPAIEGSNEGSVWALALDVSRPECGALHVERDQEGSFVAVNTTAADWGEGTGISFGSGIRKVDFLRLKNMRGFVNDDGPFDEDDSVPLSGLPRVRIRGERVEGAAHGAIITRVYDGAGLFADCDPVVSTLAGEVPAEFKLEANYPNPFREQTAIRFQLPEGVHVRLTVYDVLGREVVVLVDEEIAPGAYEAEWSAEGHPSGVYFYRLEAGAFRATGRMTLVR